MNMQELHSVFYPGNDMVFISSAVNPQSVTNLEKILQPQSHVKGIYRYILLYRYHMEMNL